MDERLNRAPVGVIEATADGTVTGVNDAARESVGVDPDDAAGAPLSAVFPRSVEGSLRDAFDDEGVDDAEFEEYYPEPDVWLAVTVVPTADGATVYLRDVTARRRNAQDVERLRTERDRTAVIDELLSAVLANLVSASSREEIAETICTELGDTDLYEFAWVGERDVDGDGLVVQAAAGQTGETFAAVRDALGGDATTPEERAAERGESQVVQPLAEGDEMPESVRVAGFADGVQSMLAVPLVYGSNVYGAVGVYADGRDAFSERERASFETLGGVAGLAVTAARNRSLLLSDTVTEVTFSVGDDSALASLSAALDVDVALEGVVPYGADALLCYLALGTDDADAVRRAAADIDGIGDVRALSESGAGRAFEVELRGETPLLTVSTLGGTVREATFERGGRGEIVVNLPPDGEVRRMAEAIRREFDADVVAKRERKRSVTTPSELRDALESRLTDRQRTVLRTAYLADYFESPRGSTAEEVAASLDITGSTLLYHLRASQRKLLAAFFEE